MLYVQPDASRASPRSVPTDTGAGLRALDVGCGTGHHLKTSSRVGSSFGIDGSAAMLEEARQATPTAELRQADVQVLPFRDQSFDLVLCIEVLRYLADPERASVRLPGCLRPGGTCLATAAPLFSVMGIPYSTA